MFNNGYTPQETKQITDFIALRLTPTGARTWDQRIVASAYKTRVCGFRIRDFVIASLGATPNTLDDQCQ